jgi:hypothetical protein
MGVTGEEGTPSSPVLKLSGLTYPVPPTVNPSILKLG